MTLVEQLRARADNPDAIYSSTDAKRDRDAADQIEHWRSEAERRAHKCDQQQHEIERLRADIRALNRELDSWEAKSRHD